MSRILRWISTPEKDTATVTLNAIWSPCRMPDIVPLPADYAAWLA